MTEQETRLELSRDIVRRQTKIREELIDTYLSACGVPALIRYDNGDGAHLSDDNALIEIIQRKRSAALHEIRLRSGGVLRTTRPPGLVRRAILHAGVHGYRAASSAFDIRTSTIATWVGKAAAGGGFKGDGGLYADGRKPVDMRRHNGGRPPKRTSLSEAVALIDATMDVRMRAEDGQIYAVDGDRKVEIDDSALARFFVVEGNRRLASGEYQMVLRRRAAA